MPAKHNFNYGKKSEASQKKKDDTEEVTQYYLPGENGEKGEELFDMKPSETVKYTEKEFEVVKILNAVDLNGSRNFYVEWKPSWVHSTMISQACLDTWDQRTVEHIIKKTRRKKRTGNRH